MRTMRIKRPYYNYIIGGEKSLEVRVGYSGIKKYQVGELIELSTNQSTCKVRIVGIRIYASFDEMLQNEPWEKIVPRTSNVRQVVSALKRVYPAEKEALGVYVFEIKLV